MPTLPLLGGAEPPRACAHPGPPGGPQAKPPGQAWLPVKGDVVVAPHPRPETRRPSPCRCCGCWVLVTRPRAVPCFSLAPGPCCCGEEQDIGRGGAPPPGFSPSVPIDAGDLETQREFCACAHFCRMSTKVFCVSIIARPPPQKNLRLCIQHILGTHLLSAISGPADWWGASVACYFNQCVLGQVASHVCCNVFMSSRKFCGGFK